MTRRQLGRTAAGGLAASLLLVSALHAQAPMALKVLSATLDPETHDIIVQFQSASAKTIVAYSLDTACFDGQGTRLGDFRREFDYIGPAPNPGRENFVPSGGMVTVRYTKPAPPDPRLVKAFPHRTPPDYSALEAMASVQVSVLALVFEDRTYEESEQAAAIDIFYGRIAKLDHARQAVKLMKDYPASPEEGRKALAGLRLLGFNAPEQVRSKEHWETIRGELQTQADWWETQSQPQGATK